MKQGSPFLLIAALLLGGCASEPQVETNHEQAYVPVSDVAVTPAPPLSSDHFASQESSKEVIKLSPTEETIDEPAAPLYAIQVLGLRDQSKISKLVDELPMGMPAWVVESERDGQPWYSVLVGDYASYDGAKQSLSDLSAKGLPQGAFVKQVPLEGTIRLR